MRIDHLHIENFKKFEKQDFDFHPHFTLLVGDNGSGNIRTGHVSLNEGYARVRDGELWLLSMRIRCIKNTVPYVDPDRPRKLLLHRKEIDRLTGLLQEKGLTLVPTRLFFKRGRVKVALALARGKKLWDKRREERDRDVRREIARAVRGQL